MFTMGEAANGKDAMDQIEKLQPQIVISDVVMPLMDGVDFTVAVHHRYPHIQMIILSGYDNFEYVKQTLMQGVVDYILKPTLTPHELLGVLQKAAARIPGWHPDHAMTGETAEEQKQEKNCKRYLPHHMLQNYEEEFVALDDRVDYDKYVDYKRKLVEHDGKSYGIPFDCGTAALFYRLDILEQAGFSEADMQNLTWSRYMEIGQQVYQKTGIPMLTLDPTDLPLVRIIMQQLLMAKGYYDG